MNDFARRKRITQAEAEIAFLYGLEVLCAEHGVVSIHANDAHSFSFQGLGATAIDIDIDSWPLQPEGTHPNTYKRLIKARQDEVVNLKAQLDQ